MATLNFHNCSVHINQGKIDQYNEYSQPNPVSKLPAILATEAAMALWKMAQAAGWIDANYQPLISKAQASLLADYIGKKLNLTDRWKPFIELWGFDSIRKDFDHAFSSPKAGEFIELIQQKMAD